MKRNKLILFSTVLFVYAVICLNSCEEDCDPCEVNCPVPTDPADRIIGVWIIFESYFNGNPEPGSVGLALDFRSNDSLLAMSDTLGWYATEEHILILQDSPIGTMGVAFDYYFEVDTLDMTGVVYGDTIRWRLLEEENMPPP